MTCGEVAVSRNVTCGMGNLKNVTTELKCGKCEEGRISKAGAAQVTRCSSRPTHLHESNRVDTVSEVRTALQLWLHI